MRTAKQKNQIKNILLDCGVVLSVTIFQKFLEKDHTQMELDTAHALIKRKSKGVPSQCSIFIREKILYNSKSTTRVQNVVTHLRKRKSH